MNLKTSVKRVTEEKELLLIEITELKQKNYELDCLFKASEEDKDNLHKMVTDMRASRSRRITDLEAEIEAIQRNFENEVRSLRAKITKLESDVEIAIQERDH